MKTIKLKRIKITFHSLNDIVIRDMDDDEYTYISLKRQELDALCRKWQKYKKENS